MKTEYLKNYWRKLDNVAKVFSLDDKNNTNIFRYSVILKQRINKNILKKALMKTLDNYKSFKVKIGTGFFWNYLEFNPKEPIVKEENEIPCQHINFKKNNDYLFKITYYKKKINLDIFHVLTDGTGATQFLKSVIYNYLNIKHNLKSNQNINTNLTYQDQYLKNYDKSIKVKNSYKLAYQIKGKINKNINNTYHYIMDICKIKNICKKYKVTITEYLTATYIYAIYLSMHKNKSKKEISVTIPINLRKYYQVDTLSNFFVCTNINPQMIEKKLTTFDEVLHEVHKDFQDKLSIDNVKSYLTRDVKLGTSLPIRLVPLCLKRIFIKSVINIASQTSTSTLSNIGIIDIDDKYKKYIDNILVLVMPGRYEKIKCTICSYDNKLNLTMNSNINDTKFEQTFFCLLKKQISNIKLESNTRILKGEY